MLEYKYVFLYGLNSILLFNNRIIKLSSTTSNIKTHIIVYMNPLVSLYIYDIICVNLTNGRSESWRHTKKSTFFARGSTCVGAIEN